MKNSQLAEALKTLSRDEFKEFGKFVHSPFFNNRSELIRFYNSLKKVYPDFNSDAFSKEKLFKRIYPGKRYSDVLMRKASSLMLGLLQNYFSEINSRNTRLAPDQNLLESLRNRKLFKLWEKKYSSYKSLLDNSKHNMEVYEFKYKLSNELRNADKPSGLKDRIEKQQSSIDSIYNYFFSVILNENLQLISLSKNTIHKYPEHKFFNDIIGYIGSNNYQKQPLIYIYYLMLMLMNTSEEKYFKELLAYREAHSGKLETVHNYNVIVILLSYCFDNIEKGNLNYRKIFFRLSQSLDKENLFDPHYTDPITFVNIIRNAAILKKTDWSLKFIDKYKHGLNASIRDSIVNYSCGIAEFAGNNFSKSMKYLSAANVKWDYMKYDVKKLLIMNCYELGYTEELFLQIDALKHFIKRDKEITEKNLINHRLFIKFVQKIINLSIQFNFQETEILIKKINAVKYFPRKEWIEEKANELLYKKKAVSKDNYIAEYL